MSDTPKRITLRRAAGWRKPEGAIVVKRPGQWGNPYKVVPTRVRTPTGFARRGHLWVVVHVDRRGAETGPEWGVWETKRDATVFAVELHRRAVLARLTGPDGDDYRAELLDPLTGHDLACACEVEDEHGRVPCHGDTWLALANPGWVP